MTLSTDARNGIEYINTYSICNVCHTYMGIQYSIDMNNSSLSSLPSHSPSLVRLTVEGEGHLVKGLKVSNILSVLGFKKPLVSNSDPWVVLPVPLKKNQLAIHCKPKFPDATRATSR